MYIHIHNNLTFSVRRNFNIVPLLPFLLCGPFFNTEAVEYSMVTVFLIIICIYYVILPTTIIAQ